MKKLFALILVLMLSFAFLQADYYIKQETKTAAFEIMGQKNPAKTIIQETWMGKNVYAQVSKDTTTIVDSAKKVMYFVNHKDKTYVELVLPLDISKYIPSQMAGMVKQMLDSMTVSIAPNQKTEKIKNWNTKGYDMKIGMSMMGMQMNMNMELFATKDVPFDYKKIFSEFLGNTMQLTGQMGEKVIAEMKKVDGFTVLTKMTMNMMGSDIKVNSAVLEISEKSAPAGLYAVPAGYKKVDKLPARTGM